MYLLQASRTPSAPISILVKHIRSDFFSQLKILISRTIYSWLLLRVLIAIDIVRKLLFNEFI